MKPMILLARGVMVSLSALAVVASVILTHAHGESPRPNAAGWSLRAPGGKPAGDAQNGAEEPVPRGNLRGDIANNARQREAPQRPPPPRPHR